MVSVLYRGSVVAVNQCLYALANLVELEGEIVNQLFEFGLAKALLQLNS